MVQLMESPVKRLISEQRKIITETVCDFSGIPVHDLLRRSQARKNMKFGYPITRYLVFYFFIKYDLGNKVEIIQYFGNTISNWEINYGKKLIDGLNKYNFEFKEKFNELSLLIEEKLNV